LRASDLRGFEIPGVADKVIVSLFADDTTIYLSELDSFDRLVSILDLWCMASRAKFNKDKTEAIPMGTAAYRAQLLTTRQLQPDAPLLPADMRIAADDTGIRILGAWIGNGLTQMEPWTNTVEKIAAALKRWGRCNPTLRGRRLIAQMIVAGMTQYLAKVQGMPAHVEMQIRRITRNFVWKDANASPVGMDTLFLPIRDGGIKLVDIQTRNEAIELTWLKSYLDLSDSRPIWAFVADVLITESVMAVDRNTVANARVNPYLQSWHVSTHATSPLPEELKTMLKVARKYDANFTAIKLSDSMKRRLPVWYH
ncbi:hypothetical protein BDW22DRAFT_1299598, partial [Trametopsis cervina]